MPGFEGSNRVASLENKSETFGLRAQTEQYVGHVSRKASSTRPKVCGGAPHFEDASSVARALLDDHRKPWFAEMRRKVGPPGNARRVAGRAWVGMGGMGF